MFYRCSFSDVNRSISLRVTLSKYEEMLVGYGALSLGTIIGAHALTLVMRFTLRCSNAD